MPEVLALAQKGTYSFTSPELVGERIFERLTSAEMQEMFDRDGEQLSVQPWIKEGIVWHRGDAGECGGTGHRPGGGFGL